MLGEARVEYFLTRWPGAIYRSPSFAGSLARDLRWFMCIVRFSLYRKSFHSSPNLVFQVNVSHVVCDSFCASDVLFSYMLLFSGPLAKGPLKAPPH